MLPLFLTSNSLFILLFYECACAHVWVCSLILLPLGKKKCLLVCIVTVFHIVIKVSTSMFLFFGICHYIFSLSLGILFFLFALYAFILICFAESLILI